jgi:hypothetical protein
MSNRKIVAFIAIPVLAVLALAGCAQGTESASRDESSASEPAPDSPITIDEVETGAVLTDEQFAALRGVRDDGMTAYTLPNGDRILVRENEPLPPAVQADAEAKADALPISSGDSIDAQLQTAKGGDSLGSQLGRVDQEVLCSHG